MNILTRAFLFTILALSLTISAHADIIPKDMKPIYVSAVLENMGDYPGYTFVQFETLGDEVRKAEVILPGRGVSKGYKLNRMEVLAVPKTLVDQAGGIKNVDFVHGEGILRSGDIRIESGQQLVPRLSSTAGKEVFYKITLGHGELELEKVGETVFKENPNHSPVNLFLYGFVVTLAVELIVFILMVRGIFRRREPGTVRAVAVVTVAQAATLPVLWFMITRYNLMGTAVMFGAESFAVVVECVIYRFFAKLTWRQAFFVALACNAASYVIGMMA